MIDAAFIVGQLARLVAAGTCGCLILVAYRWIRGQSRALGAVVAGGILVRAVVGLAMFWISYLQLPIASALQAGGGFWQVALDATGYYQMAAQVADSWTLLPLDHSSPGPAYLNLLGVWMLVVGVSPAAGMFLNLCLYVGLVTLMVRCFGPVNDARRDLPALAGIAAYSFSPVVLFHSTQPLKEELSAAALVLACVSMLPLARLVYRSREHAARAAVIGALGAAAAVFLAAGIRYYLGLIVWAALAAVFMAFAIRGRTRPLGQYTAGAVIVLAACWIGFWGGAGPHYRIVGANIDRLRLADIPADMLNRIQLARAGFLFSGGSSNVVVPVGGDEAEARAQSKLLTARQHASAHYVERLEIIEARERHFVDGVAPVVAVPAAIQWASLPGYEVGVGPEPPQPVAHAEPERARAGPPSASATAGASAQAARPSAQTETEKPPPAPAAPASSAPVPRVSAAPGRLATPAQLPWRALPATAAQHVLAAVTGIGIVFLPTGLFEMLSDVQVPGGRGLLLFADIDTIFFDATTLLILGLAWSRRAAIGHRLPLVAFAIVLSTTIALLLAYVVTNYGTLLRMRALAFVPLWLLVVAVSPGGASAAASSRPATSPCRAASA